MFANVDFCLKPGIIITLGSILPGAITPGFIGTKKDGKHIQIMMMTEVMLIKYDDYMVTNN